MKTTQKEGEEKDGKDEKSQVLEKALDDSSKDFVEIKLQDLPFVSQLKTKTFIALATAFSIQLLSIQFLVSTLHDQLDRKTISSAM